MADIAKDLSKDAKLPGGKSMAYALGTIPEPSHYILSGFGQIKDLLKSKGFDIVEEADDILEGLD